MKSHSNLVLIGMPGAGKSTVGVLSAKALGLDFLDTDVAIQQATGNLLQDIIREHGIETFLEIEDAVLSSLEADNCVIATGGSAVLCPQAMQQLRRESLVVYLSVPLAELQRRITNMGERGIAMEAGQQLADVFAEREPHYNRLADHIVACHDLDIEQTVHAVNKIWLSHLV